MIALVAWRGGPRAKSRLATVLSPADRADLADQMLGFVLTALGGARSIARTYVVAPTRPSGARAVWVNDDGKGLNAAFALGLAEIGAGPVLLLPADLPMLRSTTIDALAAMYDSHDVVIAPDRSDSGTNALLIDSATRMAPAFGPASFDRHRAQARATGARVGVFEADDLAFDIDLPEDWRAFQREAKVLLHA